MTNTSVVDIYLQYTTANSLLASVQVLDSNSTTTTPSSDLWKWSAYIVQGLLLCVLNMLVFLTIGKHRALHMEKQYVMVAALALADSLNGLAFILAGIYRTVVTCMGEEAVMVTSWWCLMTPHNLLWLCSDTLATLMLLVVSIDRLLSVAMPLHYLLLPQCYASVFVGIAYLYSCISGAVGFTFGYLQPNTARHEKVCFTVSATGRVFYAYFGTVNIVFAIISVVVYAAVLVIVRTYYSKRIRKLTLSAKTGAHVKQQMERQRRMTQSLAISCLFTLILYCIPSSVGNILATSSRHNKLRLIAVYGWIISNFNPLLNVLIYVGRHKEMRRGIAALLGGRHLPPDLHSWTMQ